MLVSVEWLKEYVDVDVPVEEFCDRMILSGSNIETVETFGNKATKIVVGKILKIEPHPDADKLVVCTLDIGAEEPQTVVTGAKNVFEGATVPVILPGGVLPDGTKIKKSKLRGVRSDGMLCSAAEMGYEDKVISLAIKDGIWILEDTFTPGTEISDALQLHDSVIDFEITPNRPDCLSVIGMAREAAAVFQKELRYPDSAPQQEEGRVDEILSVEIRRPDLCPRYTARVIKDVKIGPSPWWLQRRLMHGGMRPINNIVDITNYVMMEYGQPLHAFDIRQVEGGKIIVDTAKNGDRFTTLDGTERELDETMLMIHDAGKQIAVAGVMGGLNSEIQEDTTMVVLEAANFNGDSVRRTSKKLGLRTEASGRYEKGIDANLCSAAADRFCRLVELTGSGTVVGGLVDAYPEVQKSRPLDVRVSRINHVLGTDIPADEMAGYLRGLEMQVEAKGDILTVTPPTVRQDLEIEEDYVEEVARMYGYDRIPETIPGGGSAAKKTAEEELRSRTRDLLNGYGLDEVLTYSFVSPRSVDRIQISESDLSRRNFVTILNPLGEENSVMRTTLTPNMMDVLAKNAAMGNKSVGLFEIGKIFNNVAINCDGQPAEAEDLCIGLYGGNTDFFYLKGIVNGLLDGLGIESPRYEAESGLPTYHPGRCANIISNGALIGTIGEMHPDVSERYGIETRVYTCELLFSEIMRQSNTAVIYRPLPKYPAVTRDIALLVAEDVPVGTIESLIREHGGNLLESAELFDVYRGKQILPGKKSVAFALVYRDPEKTLTDEEVSRVHDRILHALQEELGASLREV